jgi:tetratricopeptide (TPR) repeat protein
MRRFAVSVLADAAASLGRPDDAGQLFAAATADDPANVPLVSAYADLLLDQGRNAEALSLLENAGWSDPVLLRKAIAAKRLDDSRFTEWRAILAERFQAARAGGVRIHLREEARFFLEIEDDAAAALPLAVANWSVQKEPADIRLLLAASLAAGQPEAARPALEFVRRTGLDDRRLLPFLARLENAR